MKKLDVTASSQLYLVLKLIGQGPADGFEGGLSTMYVIPPEDLNARLLGDQQKELVHVTSETAELVLVLLQSGILGVAKAYQVYVESARQILMASKRRVAQRGDKHDSSHTAQLAKKEVATELEALAKAFSGIESYTTVDAVQATNGQFSECDNLAVSAQAPCAPLIQGQGLGSVVDSIVDTWPEEWKPAYGEIGEEWKESKGNGGGRNLNQYTITMQVLCTRSTDMQYGILNTSKWCERQAVVMVQANGYIGMRGDFTTTNGPHLEKNKWCTISMAVDLVAGELSLVFSQDSNGTRTSVCRADKYPILGDLDGAMSIPMDDQPRVCLFGDGYGGGQVASKERSGGWLIRNFRFDATALPITAINQIHSNLTPEIEKSWTIASSQSVSHGFEGQKKILMDALNISEDAADDLLRRNGGSAAAVMNGDHQASWKHDDY